MNRVPGITYDLSLVIDVECAAFGNRDVTEFLKSTGFGPVKGAVNLVHGILTIANNLIEIVDGYSCAPITTERSEILNSAFIGPEERVTLSGFRDLKFTHHMSEVIDCPG